MPYRRIGPNQRITQGHQGELHDHIVHITNTTRPDRVDEQIVFEHVDLGRPVDAHDILCTYELTTSPAMRTVAATRQGVAVDEQRIVHPRRRVEPAPESSWGKGIPRVPVVFAVVRVWRRVPRDVEDLVCHLSQRANAFGQSVPPGQGGAIDPPGAPVNNNPVRGQETLGFHPVQRGVQGARADPIAVPFKFGRHPSAMDGILTCVVQDVQPDGAPHQLIHPTAPRVSCRRNSALRLSISLADIYIRYRSRRSRE